MHTLSPTLRSNRGYSVMELTTVMVLVGILSTLAVPSLQGYVNRNRARRALDLVAADLSYARLLAVRDGRSHRVRVESGDRYVLERVLSGGQAEAVKQVDLSAEFPGTAFELPDGGLQLEFTPRGLVRDLAGEAFIKVANRDARDSIFVSPAGRVYRGY